MKKRVLFLEPAESELLEAALYYENQSKGLGLIFLAEIRHAIKGILKQPRSYPIIRSKIRRRLVRCFPL